MLNFIKYITLNLSKLFFSIYFVNDIIAIDNVYNRNSIKIFQKTQKGLASNNKIF